MINISVINGMRNLFEKCKGYVFYGGSVPEIKYTHHAVFTGPVPDVNMLLPVQAGCLMYFASAMAFPCRYSDILQPEINSPHSDGVIQS